MHFIFFLPVSPNLGTSIIQNGIFSLFGVIICIMRFYMCNRPFKGCYLFNEGLDLSYFILLFANMLLLLASGLNFVPLILRKFPLIGIKLSEYTTVWQVHPTIFGPLSVLWGSGVLGRGITLFQFRGRCCFKLILLSDQVICDLHV